MTIKTITEGLRARFGDAIRIGVGCDLSADLSVEIDEAAILILGDRVSIRRGTTIQAHRGATVVIGNDVAIGENSFISAMVGIRIGDGVGISNMVDLHDHNHRDRSIPHLPSGERTPWASGFSAAPIIVEPCAVISNKVSITAGVRIGQNTIIGANSTVTHSIGPNTIAAGSPASPKRTFDALLSGTGERPQVDFAWFGTSIMQHFEGFNSQMVSQAALPAVGSAVEVEAWRNRGYVDRLHTTLQARWPYLDILFRNHGEGGATSRDILQIVRANIGGKSPAAAVSFLGCGINDVWRGFQGRHDEAVDLAEYTDNYRNMVELLTTGSRHVICIGETPFGWDDALDVSAANVALEQYNKAAARIAAAAGVAYIDVAPTFTATARQLTGNTSLSLWSDGVHLSENGDALLHDLVDAHLREHDTVYRMTTYQPRNRDEAVQLYRFLFDDVRGSRA